MRKMTKRRLLSMVLVVAMLLTMMPATAPARAEETLSTKVKTPFSSGASIIPLDDSTVSSDSYRIPAMVTLKDGTILAAADIRWDTTYDGGGLDTLVARSSDGGVSWEYTLANYLGDNGNAYNGSSTCFIDPCLTVAADGQTVYMLCDLYPYGVALNGSKETAPSEAVGFTNEGYLKLSANNHGSYDYYLDDGKIYSTGGSVVSGYTVDGYFNLYYNGTKTSNLFYSDSPFKVVRTGFLYLTKSVDGGKNWSAPTLLDLKTSSEQVCLVGPGRGITTKNGVMIFPVYSYRDGSETTGFVYSDDGGISWKRSASLTQFDSSEAAVVELNDGRLRCFFRNHTAKLYYADYNLTTNTWSSCVNTGIAVNSNTQLSAITYSKTVNGKQVVLVSCPTGPNANGSNNNDGSCRINGRIFAGLVNTDGTMDWTEAINVTGTSSAQLSGSNYTEAQGFFAYSCLTERSDGSIAILYEDNQFGWGSGTGKYYTITMKAYSASALGLTFDEGSGSGGVTPDPDVPIDGNTITLQVGQTVKLPVSDTETVGTAGTFTSTDGNVQYVVRHFETVSGYQMDTDGIDSGKKYLLVCSGNYAVTTSSSAQNPWSTESLPLTQVAFDNSSAQYLWTITETSGGYYLQNPSGHYMNITNQKANGENRIVALSADPVICDITPSGNGYMIFRDGTNIGLNNAGGEAYNKTALGWPSNDNTVWTLYEYVQQGGTEIEITGLAATSGTVITIGDTNYKVIVELAEKSKNVFVKNGDQTTLDAVSDLGLSGSGYTVTYEVEADESNVLTLEGATITAHGSAFGEATVLATITNAAGETVGTVTYTITVSDLLITDVEDVFVAVGNKASISGLNGEINTSLMDTAMVSIDQAAGTVLSNGTLTITAANNAANMSEHTIVVVGTTQFNIHVVPGNAQNTDAAKYIYVEVSEITNCTVYFAINGSMLHQVEGTGVLIDETFYDGFNLMFFAVPSDGYVLTTMTAALSNGTVLKDFYSMCDGNSPDGEDEDGSYSSAWPFTEATITEMPTSPVWKTFVGSDGNTVTHGFRWALLQGNMTVQQMRTMFASAIAYGAEGATTVTKNENEGVNVSFAFRAEKLPTLEKSIVAVNGKTYTEGMTLNFGDIVTYQFVVTSTSSAQVTYSDVVLVDDAIGYRKEISSAALAQGTYTATADYEIKVEDLDKYTGGQFVNNATLHYIYTSQFGHGEQNKVAHASVSCDINGLVYYAWASDVPAGIIEDLSNYPLPGQQVVAYGTNFRVVGYTGQREYEVVENGVAIGKWTFQHWLLNGDIYYGGETVKMATTGSMGFEGVWAFEPYATYTVSYQWSGAPNVTLPLDNGAYYAGQGFTVDATYRPGDTITQNGIAYTFSGWKLDGTVVTGHQVMGQSNITLQGVWYSAQIYTSLTIRKTNHYALDVGQSYLFRIEGEGVDLVVVVHGAGQVIIEGLKVNGQYTVTEITDWSWRYSNTPDWTFLSEGETVATGNDSPTATITMGADGNEITFANSRTNRYWLDGDCWQDNWFGDVTQNEN